MKSVRSTWTIEPAVLGVAALLIAAATGCGAQPSPDAEPAAAAQAAAQPTGPAGTFAGIEQRLLDASSVGIPFFVTAEGAIEVQIEGMVTVSKALGVGLSATGQFAGEPVDLALRSTGQTFEFGNGDTRESGPVPQHLAEAVLIGFTRMGILHNLARLSGNAAPDHADGGVRDWVRVDSFQVDSAPLDPISGEPPLEESNIESALSFALSVGGQPSGSATLYLSDRGLPVMRTQTVAFPDGEMRVLERYGSLMITNR